MLASARRAHASRRACAPQTDENGGAFDGARGFEAAAAAHPRDSASPARFFARGNERLYEAFSQLHTMARARRESRGCGARGRGGAAFRGARLSSTLSASPLVQAQDFDKPFDSPAILVVGHQTDGKSGAQLYRQPFALDHSRARVTALVEALMGFQFNHVGGGTKTRRPIAINMKARGFSRSALRFTAAADVSAQYNSLANEPRCYLMKEDGVEEEMSLEDLQEFIECENRRLEAEHSFWAKEIVVRIEFRYCPNLTIIDTPGLISAAPAGRKASASGAASRAVEALVLSKMQRRDFIILCLEDTSDWGNATTRRLVMAVDPDFRRTVLVSTKFDTRIPQFSRAADVELFLRPSRGLLEASPLGGGPFFTSVPSGRVGPHRESLFRTNDAYRDAVLAQEAADCGALEARLDRRLDGGERGRVGVSRLRAFLERLLQRRYLDNVPTIVPVLEKEHTAATNKLAETRAELEGLGEEKLKERGRAFYAHFLHKIPLLLRGTVAAPAERFGETLGDERLRGGTFVGADGRPLLPPASSSSSDAGAAPPGVTNAEMRLFGGAQYHRALEEYRAAVASVRCPAVAAEEIVNACGMDDVHDGVNYTRTACVIAVAKARDALEPFLHQLGFRLAHIMRRLLPISMFLLQKEGRFLNGHDLFIKRIGACFHAFVDRTMRECQAKCGEDLQSTTEFVTWSLHANNRAGLRSVMAAGAAAGAARAAAAAATASQPRAGAAAAAAAAPAHAASASHPAGAEGASELAPSLWGRSVGAPTHDGVSALVETLFDGIRDHCLVSSEQKFNCFFFLPCITLFPARLREEIEAAMEDSLDSVFDVAAVRGALEARRAKLEAELAQMEVIMAKFAAIHSQLSRMTHSNSPEARASAAGGGAPAAGGGGGSGGGAGAGGVKEAPLNRGAQAGGKAQPQQRPSFAERARA